MANLRFSFKKRILVALVAIVVIHLLFKYVPLYVETRPRFYPGAWAEVDARLRRFVGEAVVEKGVFSIPKAEIAVSHCGGAWARTPPFLTVLMTPEGWVLTDSGRRAADAVGAVSHEEARHIMAVFHYLAVAEAVPSGGFDDIGESRGFQLHDEYVGPHATEELFASNVHATVTGALRAGLAAPYFEKLTAGFDYLEDDADISRAVKAALKFGFPPRDRFDARVLRAAVSAAAAHPSRDLVRRLRRIKRLKDNDGEVWLGRLTQLPAIRRFFTYSRRRGSLLPHAGHALGLCEAAPGPRREDRLAYLEDMVFRDARWNERLISEFPDDFTRFVLEHWDEMDVTRRLRYLRTAVKWGDGGRAIAGRAADSEDPLICANGWLVLFDITGERAHLAACIEESPMLGELIDAEAVSARYYCRGLYQALNERYARNPDLEEIPAFFAESWATLPADCRSTWGFGGGDPPVLEMLPALARSGTDAHVAILRDVVALGDGLYEEVMQTFYHPLRSSPFRYNLFLIAGGIEEALAAGGADVRNFMLAYLKDTDRRFHGCASPTFISALALSTDEEALALFEAWPALPQGSSGSDPWTLRRFRDVTTHAERAAVVIRVRRSDDVPAFLLSLAPEERLIADLVAVERLSAEKSRAELQALLADERYAPIRREILMALSRRRLLDARSEE